MLSETPAAFDFSAFLAHSIYFFLLCIVLFTGNCHKDALQRAEGEIFISDAAVVRYVVSRAQVTQVWGPNQQGGQWEVAHRCVFGEEAGS